MRRVYIETYGCQMNVSDSELVFGVLGREGYVRTEDPAEADVLLVNTCAVRDHAEQRVLGRMGELKRYKRPGDVLGVVGCMAQRLGPKLLERVPQVDLVIGPDGYRGLPELIARARDGERAAETTFRSWEHYEDVPPVRERQVSAFVTVQRGCDYRCTFCIVPMTRGPERSRKLADVVREVSGLAESGTSEVTLLGQTVNSYHDGDHDFADLLRAVGAVAGIRRLRFTSPYPTDFTPRVLAAMAETPAVCEHVHLPVQSGSSRTLKRMLRRYDREAYLDVVRALREAIPGIALSTDIIVGFPGETEADFAATLSLVEQVAFDDAYTFKYSVREGTPAVRIKDHVAEEIKTERIGRLIQVVNEPPDALRLDLFRNVILDAHGRRAFAYRVLESVRVVECHLLDQRQRCGEVRFRLARESHDDVGRQRDAGYRFPQSAHDVEVRLTIIATQHALECSRAAALHRQMHVLADGGRFGHRRKYARREIGRIGRRKAQAANACHCADCAQQVGKVVVAIVITVDRLPKKRDLAGAGLRQPGDLTHDVRQLAAPFRPARHRNDAERAPIIAATLYCDERGNLPLANGRNVFVVLPAPERGLGGALAVAGARNELRQAAITVRADHEVDLRHPLQQLRT